MAKLQRVTLAYVAGVLDARAHIAVEERHGRPQPRLAVTTSRIELLDKLAQVTGTSVSMDDRGYQRRPCGDHCNVPHSHVVRQSAKWRCDSGRATIVLFNCLPFMLARRPEALAALRIGLNAWPPGRGDTATQMQQLGWPLPTASSKIRLLGVV